MLTILKKYTLRFSLGVVIGCTVLFFQFIRTSAPSSVSAQSPEGVPLHIIIPRIHMNATIDHVETPLGTLSSPTSALTTAWSDTGPKPGEKGTAVVSGYVYWKYGATAMFADLHLVEPGDEILIEDDRGTKTHFKVRQIALYDLDEDIVQFMETDDEEPHLNLITIDGAWSKSSKSYSKRLVVTADKVSSPLASP